MEEARFEENDALSAKFAFGDGDELGSMNRIIHCGSCRSVLFIYMRNCFFFFFFFSVC